MSGVDLARVEPDTSGPAVISELESVPDGLHQVSGQIVCHSLILVLQKRGCKLNTVQREQ
jgi:hypothetical protein